MFKEALRLNKLLLKILFTTFLIIQTTLNLFAWEKENIDSTVISDKNSIAIDSNNRAHISYPLATGKLKYANNVTGFWKNYAIDFDGFFSGNAAIALDSKNKAHIICYDKNSRQLKYVTNKNDIWESSSISSTDTTDIGGKFFSAIAVDYNDVVHIAYTRDDYTSNDFDGLRYAKKTSNGWDKVNLDNLGSDASIVIDSNNNAHIVYFCTSYTAYKLTKELRYATNKSNQWQIKTIDEQIDNLGSIAINKNNRIAVCYYEYSYVTNYYNVYYLNYAYTDITTDFWTKINQGSYWDEYISGESIAINNENDIFLLFRLSGESNSGLRYLTPSGAYELDNCGYHPSLSLDANNKTHISYLDSSNNLKYITDSYIPPIANAGNDQTVILNTIVTLDGTKSSDSNKDLLTYTWSQISGSRTSLLYDTSARPSFTPNDAGIFSFKLFAYDGRYYSNFDTVNIYVNHPNMPSANAGADQTVSKKILITLDGSASSDPNNDSLTYEWAQTSGPKITLSNNNIINPNFKPTQQGIYSFQLTVKDGIYTSFPDAVNIQIINNFPIAKYDSILITEDIPITFDILKNDTDQNFDSIFIKNFTQGTKGTIVKNSNGTITYSPNADINGQDSFTYTISDIDGATSSDTVYITILPVNDAPIAKDDTKILNEDVATIIDILTNDIDLDGDRLYIKTITEGSNGSILKNENGTITYSPYPNATGLDLFYYIISDSEGKTSTAAVNIIILPTNDAPIATIDNATTNEDMPVSIKVTANDIDVDNNILSVTAVTQGKKGFVANNGEESVTYTPDSNFNGTDSFTYTISDGKGGTSSAAVNVTIISVNDAPVANTDLKTTNEETALIINVLENDTDVDGDVLKITTFAQSNKGTIVKNANNSFTYTPVLNFFGRDSFNYSISDNKGETSSATVNINIISTNDAPSAKDDFKTINEDTATTINVTANDIDVDQDTLAVATITQGKKGFAVNNELGIITYTPNANISGTDSLTYTISDGKGGSSSATVHITILSVNDAPVANNDSKIMTKNSSIDINVLTNDTDIDEDVLNITSFTESQNGTVIKSENSILTYTPYLDFFGKDSFNYTIGDGKGGSSSATVNINVTTGNDAPIANNDSISTNEDMATTINVLANDTDVEEDPFSITEITQGTKGTASFNKQGDITYIPNNNVYGLDAFTYTATDIKGGSSLGNVNILIVSVNDIPVAKDNSNSTNEDTPLIVNVLTNDTDIENNTLSITSVTQGNKGTTINNSDGTITYTPNADINGSDVFTYTMCDGNGGYDTASVIINITPIADNPIANDDSKTVDEDNSTLINILTNDVDADNDLLKITEITQGSKGSVVINIDETITYTPIYNFLGTDSFKYIITDGNGGYDSANVYITVKPVNDAPVANEDFITTDEDTSSTINLLNNDTDTEYDSLIITKFSQGAKGKVINNNDGTFTYTPNINAFGKDTFVYTISDNNGVYDSSKVNVTINEVNDTPITNDDAITTVEDTSIKINVLTNDIDADADSLIITEITQGKNGNVINNNDGTLTYSPNTHVNGTDTFNYTVNDGRGGVAIGVVKITIKSVSDLPIANAGIDQTVTIGTKVILDGTKSYDPDGDKISYMWAQINGPESIALSKVNAITPMFIPRSLGTYKIQLLVKDNRNNSIPDTTTIFVTNRNADSTNISGNEKKACVITNTIKNKKAIGLINEIKDKYLLQNTFGREVIDLYYKITTKI